MDVRSKNILNSHRQLIIKDLHGDVINNLYEKGVLNLEEYEQITSLSLQEKRNEKLLDILSNKSDSIQQFLKAIQIWYWWIEEKLQDSLKEKLFLWEEAIVHSNVPPIPPRNVSRSTLLIEVRQALSKIKKGHYVVLHGMSGCGKSSLAAEALQHDILMDQFQGKIHWLSCGQDENEIFGLQVELNERICDDELLIDVKTPNVKNLRIKLMKRFQNSDFKEGLIVLDDVNSHQVIEALNIGCKTLVTTNDINVMKNQGNRYCAIKVSEGFTEEETLKHLALCVGLSIEELPKQAQQIHFHGKGHPLIISLIGAQLNAHQDEVKTNTDSWNPYLDVLVNKEYGNLKKRYSGTVSFLPTTIELCINNLNPDMREKYADFALFVEDVNIKSEVLEILWGLPRLAVRSIMDEFVNKSLIVRKYNKTQKYYVYGIHDILLYYLKKQLNEEMIQELHEKLINRYKEVCNRDIAHLPKNDNYFFYYIGYHIANAKLYKLFPEWYFNLVFIEAKLKVAGPGDLLIDYKRYSSYFMDSSDDQSTMPRKLLNYVNFVESAGLDVRKNFDIVQLALQEPHDSEVYKSAVRLAQSRPNSTYLRFQLGPSRSRYSPLTIQMKEKISSACFSKTKSDLLVAFESGNIQAMNQKGYVTSVYEGHTERVTRLRVSSAKNIFLSVSNNCIKVWKLPELDSSISYEYGNRTPSPSQRQTDFTDIFNHKIVDKNLSWLTFEHKGVVDWACFSTDGSRMASCCSSETRVAVYEMSNQGYLLKSIRVHGTSCIFSHNNELLIIGCSTSNILIHNIVNNTAVDKLLDSYPILALFSLPGSEEEMKFGALTKATLSVWDIEKTGLHSVEQDKMSLPCLRDFNKQETESYLGCAAAVDGSIVAVSTSSGKILVCDLNDGSLICQLNQSSGNIQYLSMDESRDHMMLACFDDATIRLWTLGDMHSGKPAAMQPHFVVSWTANYIPCLAVLTYKSCVKKLFGNDKCEDIDIPGDDKINICAISSCGKYISIGTSRGKVYLHSDSNVSETSKVLTVDKYITKLKVECLGKQIFVIVGFDKTIIIWAGNKDGILQLDEAYKFTLSLSERLVECFIQQIKKELITVSLGGSVKKWNLINGTLIAEICQTRLDVTICDTDLCCSNICTVDSRRQLLIIYNLELETEVNRIQLDSIPSCCSFSLNGQKLVVGFQNGIIQVWYICEPRQDVVKSIKKTDESIESVCVSNTGLVYAATKSRVLLVTPDQGVGQAKLRVKRLALSPDDTTVVTVDTDGHMHLIDDFRNNISDTSVRIARPITKLSNQ